MSYRANGQKGNMMSSYIIIKVYTDGTFTTEFFRKKEDAQKYVKQIQERKNRNLIDIKIYEGIDTEYNKEIRNED